MLYKPTYCCNCGEKIERERWTPATSRRFCQSCEIEFKGHELLPKIGAAAILIFGLFGTGSYLTKSEKPPEIKSSQIAQTVPNGRGRDVNSPKNAVSNPANQTNPAEQTPAAANQIVQSSLSPAKSAAQNNGARAAVKKPEIQAADGTEEPNYYCGAATKKGTPCSRRVKGGGRCWQHQGQPALLPPEKLRIGGK